MRFSAKSFTGATYLGAICTGIVYWVYFKLIDDKGPTFASFSNYLVPLTGVLLGVLTLGEPLSSKKILSLFIVILGIAVSEVGGLKRKQ